jgi:hypothetical protein
MKTAFLLSLLAVLAAPALADGYVVYLDDRAGFAAALDVNPLSTVIDTGGAFATNPAAATGLASIARTGLVAGQTFSWRAYDINFSNAPTGQVTPGVVGGDIASATPVDVETPVQQGTATGAGSWGLDSGSGSTTSRNALLVDFTSTPGSLGIGHFGLDLVDFEASSAFTRGTLRLYRAGALVFSRDFDWGLQDGNNQVHFLGVVGGPGWNFDQVAVVVGDDSAGGGNSETWAADRFTFGQAMSTKVQTPEPSALGLFVLGAIGCLVAARRAANAQRRSRGEVPGRRA